MNRYKYLLQKKIEETFGKRFIHQKAKEDLLSSEAICIKMSEGVEALLHWINSEEHWESKATRLQALYDLDIELLVQDTIALIALECSKPLKLVSIAAMSARFLNMANKVDAIRTMAEVIAVLSDTDLFDIIQTKDNERLVQAKVLLDEDVLRFAFNAFYLPPMVIKPRTVRHNRDSGYITQQGESLILGFYENHHDDDICLDVINTLNSNEYELDTDFISSQTEDWHRIELSSEEYMELGHEDKLIYNMDKSNWVEFQEQGFKIQTLMLYHGNSFYLQNKVDKRGRIYTSGYHISPQGTSFKKACINLAKKEICTGMEHW